MVNEIPFGVKYARAINLFLIVALIAGGLLLAVIGFPNLLKTANIQIHITNPVIRLIVFLLLVSLGLIPAYLLIRLNNALLRLEMKAYKTQIILSIILCVVGFPWGTVLNGICLYSLTRPKVKEQFK